MRSHYSSIDQREKDQYESSPFFLNDKDDLKPTQLDIFDFDSTLFLSPSLSPTIWHPSLIRQLVGEDVFGPGWWRDYRSLDLGPMDKLEKTHWAHYWNEEVVARARESLQDPMVMTVVLTGRRTVPFLPLISRMLASKGLDFDLVGLRPDPTQESHDDHVNNNTPHRTYGASSVFKNTLDFKTSFILNLLHNIPSLSKVNMWDDRMGHVKKFQDFLHRLTRTKQLASGSNVYHVKPILPRYRPLWEHKVVTHVLETHNANELLYRQEQLWNRAISTIPWTSDDDDDNDSDSKAACLTKVAKHLSLKPIPSSTVLKLEPSVVESLRAVLEPYYTSQSHLQGWRAKAETPQWFGRHILLSPHVLTPYELEKHHGRLGTKWTIVLEKVSKPNPNLGMVAMVTLHNDDDYNDYSDKNKKQYIFPLIYKPSQGTTIAKKHFEWTDVPGYQRRFGPGVIAYAHLLGLDGKVKDGEEHQLVCLDLETKQSVLGKRTTMDDVVDGGSSHSKK
ncbi:hypothetical protein [Absidia glauca]|uniref:Swiss Army Knife RNA repair protein HAD domain-containing protein n=1 Tax=Absidia glauca TaxID=4829 RepID=A0A168N109_ABSGL|nr:hypothetical protein [Absidia glauca]